MTLGDVLQGIWVNDVLWVAVVSSLLAQFLKPFTYYLRLGHFDWRYAAANGGFPSSHSAMVSSLATGVGLSQGFDSMYFAIATVLAMIVTYDASTVRREAGEHGRALNLIIAKLLSGEKITEVPFKEVLGHNRREVAGGVIFGIVVTLVWELLIQPSMLG